MHAPAPPLPDDTALPGATPPPAAALMVDVVVLSGDLALYEAIRHAVGERNPVWRARSAEESVDLLLTGRCGVLLIDMAAVSTRPATLVEQIVDQFPDVVVVVAGRREDESMLAGLVSDGLVYRFMHKPLSPKRAGMFLNAAIRSHVERREGRAGERLLPLVRELRSRVDPRKWIFVGAGLALFLALLAGVLVSQFGKPRGADPTPAGGSAATAPSTGPLADPVLSRARAALAAGRYEAPPGRNALDLYSAVLLTNPDSAEAHKGLQTTIARLLADAEVAADSGDAAEARRIADRVLQVDADNAGARALLAGLAPKPRQAAVTHPTPRTNPALETGAAPTSAAPVPAAGTGAIPVQQPPAPVAAVAPARPAPNAVTVVRPDPLMPRVVGPGVLPTSPSRKPQPVSRSFGAPASSGHPTAGYVERTPGTMARGAPAVIPELRTSASVQQRDLEPVTTPDPAYPPQAFREGVEGWVEVEFTVTERGTTRDIEVVGAEPRAVFDDAAIAAVTNWSYRPRVVNGQPVAQRLSVTLRFNVDD